MKRLLPVLGSAGLAAVAAVVAFAGTARGQTAPSPGASVRADTGRPRYTDADVAFMTGMIRHHAQAVLMAGWAPSHGASPSVQTLCGRIVVAQRDEIVFMQHWLEDRKQPVPDADASMDMMPGMAMELMPGMLTAEQLAQLNNARGVDFDRQFLSFMIMHHQGALTMVKQLLSVPGAAEDDIVFKYISDVNADQTTEIDRMNLMLSAIPAGARNP